MIGHHYPSGTLYNTHLVQLVMIEYIVHDQVRNKSSSPVRVVFVYSCLLVPMQWYIPIKEMFATRPYEHNGLY